MSISISILNNNKYKTLSSIKIRNVRLDYKNYYFHHNCNNFNVLRKNKIYDYTVI